MRGSYHVITGMRSHNFPNLQAVIRASTILDPPKAQVYRQVVRPLRLIGSNAAQ
jgi:hypothetical protein